MAAEEIKSANAPENWCVILQSYSQKHKKDIVKHIVEIFGLERKDAEAALSGTPLILLDDLSFVMAGRIKEFFQKTEAIVETTNHDMIKKNCYQILWSARPDLSFFMKQEIAGVLVPQPPLPASVPPYAPPSVPPPAPAVKKSVFEKFREAEKKPQEARAPAPVPPPAPGHEAKVQESAEQIRRAEEEKKKTAALPVKQPEPPKLELPPLHVPGSKRDEEIKKEFEARAAAFTQEAESWRNRVAQSDQRARELEVLIVQKENRIKEVERALGIAQAKEAGSVETAAQLQRRLSELEKGFAVKQNEQQGSQSALEEHKARAANLEDLLAERDRENAGLKTALAERNLGAENFKAALAELQAKESELVHRADALQRSLTELNDALRQSEKALRSRDEAFASSEQRIAEMTAQVQEFNRIREEHARLTEERATIRQEYDAKLSGQEARLAKIEEEGRRYRSRSERKIAAATRELGEWIRAIELLRQGLQKLIMFLGSDSAVQDPDKKTLLKPTTLNRPPRPPENNPQQ